MVGWASAEPPLTTRRDRSPLPQAIPQADVRFASYKEAPGPSPKSSARGSHRLKPAVVHKNVPLRPTSGLAFASWSATVGSSKRAGLSSPSVVVLKSAIRLRSGLRNQPTPETMVCQCLYRVESSKAAASRYDELGPETLEAHSTRLAGIRSQKSATRASARVSNAGVSPGPFPGAPCRRLGTIPARS
jgi:hypothetical protein